MDQKGTGASAAKKLQVCMPNGKLIRREKMTDTFRDFVMEIGWEDVKYGNFDYRGKELITQEHPNGWYKELVPGWFVYTDIDPKDIAMMVRTIAKTLGKGRVTVSWD